MENRESILEKEIEALYRAHYRSLCLVALSYIPDAAQGQDLVQDFFINYWERRHQGIEPPDHFAAYARRAVRNLCIDFIRRQEVAKRRQPPAGSENMEPDPFVAPMESVEEEDAYQKRLEQIFALIDQLPAGQRAILRLHALEKLSYAQIAQRQGVSINTVRTQLTRAYKSLRHSTSGMWVLYLLKYL